MDIPNEAWRDVWPRNGNLKSWLRAMIKVCDAISEDDEASERAHLPIQHLAAQGSVDEALRHVNRFLRRQPKTNVLATVRMAKLGAQIALAAEDPVRMEKYLSIALATEPFNTRKCDKGFSIKAVREFRARNGLLDPAEAKDAQQKVIAQFEGAVRKYRQAIKAGQTEAAINALTEMGAVASSVDEWWRHIYLRRVMKFHTELKDAAAINDFLNKLSESDRHKLLDAETLCSLGMLPQAIDRAQKEISQRLKNLHDTNSPDHEARSIQASVEFLVRQGARDQAKFWLGRVLEDMPSWPMIQRGTFTSAVYLSLAKAVALLDGPAAARAFVEKATTEAQAEGSKDFRAGALGAVVDLKASMEGLEEAIQAARKLRSPSERTKRLATLLARAKRWTELAELLSQIKTAKDAADVAWWIKFELPGGQAR